MLLSIMFLLLFHGPQILFSLHFHYTLDLRNLKKESFLFVKRQMKIKRNVPITRILIIKKRFFKNPFFLWGFFVGYYLLNFIVFIDGMSSSSLYE